jgi:hypothetical protein
VYFQLLVLNDNCLSVFKIEYPFHGDIEEDWNICRLKGEQHIHPGDHFVALHSIHGPLDPMGSSQH